MMGLSSEPSSTTSGCFTSPDLRLRTSVTMWGPLQLTLTNHREGVERGYEAGQIAYREDNDETLEEAMHRSLAAPRYRPRTCTPTIIQEWQAMFLLGWTSQLLEDCLPARETDDQPPRQRHSEAYQPTGAEGAFVAQGRGER